MVRYHLFPFLVPKWVPYEVKVSMGAEPDFAATERAWDYILKMYHTRWYKRWLYQPWFSWEYHGTADRVNIFLLTPDDYLGTMTWDAYANEMGEIFVIENTPPKFNFNMPHAGAKFHLTRDFSVPLLREQDGSVDPYNYLINMVNGMGPDMHAVIQFLIRPVYDSKVYSHFQKAIERVQKSPGLPNENDMYIEAITKKLYKTKAEVSIKVCVFGPSKDNVQNTLDVLVHSFGAFQSEEMNRLEYKSWWRTIRPLFRYELQHRVFPMRRLVNANILGTDEMANLLRHPTSGGTSKFIKLKFQKVSIPHKLRIQGKTDKPKLHLGINEHFASNIDTYLPLELLNNHMIVLGAQDSGKGEFLLDLITQLVDLSNEENKMGFTVIDTVGNLAREVIARVPKEKHHRIRALKLNNGKFPMNLFEWDFEAPITMKTRLLSFFFGKDGSPMLLDHFVMIGTALQKLNLATLRNMQRFFEDAEFRERIYYFLKDEEDPDYAPVRKYLEKYLSLDTFQKEFMNSPISQMLRSFNTSGTTGPFRMKTNALDFTKNMTEGKFQIIDISNMPVDDAHTIGKHVLAYLHNSLLYRGQSMIDQGKTPTMHPIILHEASGFLSKSIFRMIETFIDQARQFNTPLILSLQGIKNHVPKDVADAIFRRIISTVAFQLRNSNDANFVVESTNSEVTGITAQDLGRIDPGYCYIQLPENKQPSGLFTLRPNKPKPGEHYDIIDDFFEQTLKEALEKETKAVEEMNRQEEERLKIWEREKENFRKELEQKKKEVKQKKDLEDYLQFMYGVTGENKFGQMN